MMERICVATSVVDSGFKDDGGVLGLDPLVMGSARWIWGCWIGFDIVWVSVEFPAAGPREASDRCSRYMAYRVVICWLEA